MAGSRIEKLGTIFSRATGLLKSGALKIESKPLWYDVYEEFPPQIEPNNLRPTPAQQQIIDIIYPEDFIRARFYKEFGSPGLIDLINSAKFKNLSQVFMEKYIEIARKKKILNDDEIFKETENQMLADGFKLRFHPKESIQNKQFIQTKESSKEFQSQSQNKDSVSIDVNQLFDN